MAGENKVIVVAIDNDKGSQHALKWAVNQLLKKPQTVTLLHVRQPKSPSLSGELSKEFFLPYHRFCSRKNIQCNEIILTDADVPKAINDYVPALTVEILVVGASSNVIAKRFRGSDIPSLVLKGAPDYCTIYVVGKGKLSSMRNATLPVPNNNSPTPSIMQQQRPSQARSMSETSLDTPMNMMMMMPTRGSRVPDKPFAPRRLNEDMEIKSPFTRVRPAGARSYGEISTPETDISFVSSARPSTDSMFASLYDSFDSGSSDGGRLSNFSERTSISGSKSIDSFSSFGFSSPIDSGRISCSSQSTDDVEAEMRRLKLELKQTMDMYSSVCKEGLIEIVKRYVNRSANTRQ